MPWNRVAQAPPDDLALHERQTLQQTPPTIDDYLQQLNVVCDECNIAVNAKCVRVRAYVSERSLILTLQATLRMDIRRARSLLFFGGKEREETPNNVPTVDTVALGMRTVSMAQRFITSSLFVPSSSLGTEFRISSTHKNDCTELLDRLFTVALHRSPAEYLFEHDLCLSEKEDEPPDGDSLDGRPLADIIDLLLRILYDDVEEVKLWCICTILLPRAVVSVLTCVILLSEELLIELPCTLMPADLRGLFQHHMITVCLSLHQLDTFSMDGVMLFDSTWLSLFIAH